KGEQQKGGTERRGTEGRTRSRQIRRLFVHQSLDRLDGKTGTHFEMDRDYPAGTADRLFPDTRRFAIPGELHGLGEEPPRRLAFLVAKSMGMVGQKETGGSNHHE